MARLVSLPCRIVAAGALSLLAGGCLRAQEAAQDHSCTVDAGVAFTLPEGADARNFVSHGIGFQAGGGFAVTPQPRYGHAPQWFVTANYLFARIDANSSALTNAGIAGATSAHGAFSAITLDLSPRVRLGRRAGVYGDVGFGWLRRGISLNGDNSNSLLQSSNPTLARRASNSGVFDAAAGATYTPDWLKGGGFFVEARVYHGLAINRTTTLVPLSAGYRW